ncbi:MAG: baseplate J/gp47 family protein [Novosphingobium sp.]
MSWPSGDIRRETRVARLRQASAAGAAEVNGIVAVEVAEQAGKTVLLCELVFAPAVTTPSPVKPSDIAITGGVRRPQIKATSASITGNILKIIVAERGDFSIYQLSLRRGGNLLAGFDPILSDIPVGFRLGCQQGFDCEAERAPESDDLATASIDYMARDYAGFLRLMVDRFAQLTPGWKDAGAASPEVTLIEMLADLADRLAYAQDAVATEAYLDTARLRVSAKRHARLVDYRMSDGSNARAFVHVRVREPVSGAPLLASISTGTRFMTRSHGVAVASGETPDVLVARTSGAQVFEAFEPARLSSRHNRIEIHDWGEGNTAVLPRGTTTMAVIDEGRLLDLRPDDLLLIEEVLDRNGNASPDPARRHVVRLTGVTTGIDPVGKLVAGAPGPLEIVNLAWGQADALPFDLPLQRLQSLDKIDGIEPSPDQPTAVARGNMVAADHGEWPSLGDLPPNVVVPGLEKVLPQRRPGRRRFEIPLSDGPITVAAPVEPGSAAMTLAPSGQPLAQLGVSADAGIAGTTDWKVVDEIFDTTGKSLVLDLAEGGRGTLRSGSLEDEESSDFSVPFMVRYRLGGGTSGNVGGEAIAHLLCDPHFDRQGVLIAGLSARPGDIELVRNPLPAVGGTDLETVAMARLRAPITFRQQDRAVTPDDYVHFLLQHALVSNARAIEQWTGAGSAIVLLVDLVGGGKLDEPLEADFRKHLERYRLAGHMLEFRDPVLIPVELAMRVCVRSGVPRDAVLKRLSALFSAGVLPDGSRALFHPDNFGFGTSLRLSRLYAAAQAIDGVVHVEITALRRQGVSGSSDPALETGTLDFSAYEIPILANDPNFPDRGVVHFTMEGGA